MSVVTVTLNPALDLTVRADHFRPNTVNAGRELTCKAAGKGVNVAARLADYGIRVTATGFLGEGNPRRFERLFDEKGIQDAFVRMPGETRTNVKIVDDAQQQTTDINLPGLAPSPFALTDLRARLDTFVATHDVFVLAGSLPPGVPTDLYAVLTRELRARGRVVVVDTSGPALAAALRACPTMVKPNIHEVEAVLGRALPTESAIFDAARELVRTGIELVVISMGERGALFVTSAESVVARPPRVSVTTTVGAGDAMVAGLVAARLTGLDLAGAARLATAFSVAAITNRDGSLPDRAALDTIGQGIQIVTPAAVVAK